MEVSTHKFLVTKKIEPHDDEPDQTEAEGSWLLIFLTNLAQAFWPSHSVSADSFYE